MKSVAEICGCSPSTKLSSIGLESGARDVAVRRDVGIGGIEDVVFRPPADLDDPASTEAIVHVRSGEAQFRPVHGLVGGQRSAEGLGIEGELVLRQEM